MYKNRDFKTFSVAFDNGTNNNKTFTGAKKAFTLSESLIMMAIVGVLAAITMTSLSGLKPNKDKLLLQKAYKTILSAVSEVTNDSVAYPPLKSANLFDNELFNIRKQLCLSALMCQKLDVNGNPIETTNSDGMIAFVYTTDCKLTTITLTGTILPDIDPNISPDAPSNDIQKLKPSFTKNDYTLPNIGSVEEKAQDAQVTITPASAVLTDRSVPTRDSGKYTSTNKFAYLFAKNIVYSKYDANGGDLLNCTNNVCQFSTNDGMSWTVTDNFKTNDTNSTSTIVVDINGNKKPNKAYDASNPNSVKTPDQFTFTVHSSGQVTVSASDAVAMKYLKTRDVR